MEYCIEQDVARAKTSPKLHYITNALKRHHKFALGNLMSILINCIRKHCPEKLTKLYFPVKLYFFSHQYFALHSNSMIS